ncbi:unnamed protein product, partial [Discosporangium mesarthrocarpum]
GTGVGGGVSSKVDLLWREIVSVEASIRRIDGGMGEERVEQLREMRERHQREKQRLLAAQEKEEETILRECSARDRKERERYVMLQEALQLSLNCLRDSPGRG